MRARVIVLCALLASCAAVAGAPDQAAPFVQAPQSPSQATAQASPETPSPPADLPAGAYRLDRNHASVLFRIRHMELAWFTGRFDTIEATLELNSDHPELSQLNAQIGAASVNTGVPDANGERRFDGVIARALGAQASPQISFASTGIERTGPNKARVTGNLTLNGQTHPAVLNVTFDGARADPLRGGKVVLGFSAYGVIDRTQWGVADWRAFTGENVQIVIEAELVKT